MKAMIVGFVFWTLFCLWVIKGAGAARLQSSWITNFLFGLTFLRDHELSSEFLRDGVKVLWFISVVGFIIRFFYLLKTPS